MKKSALILILFVYANCFPQFSKTHYIPPVSSSEEQEPQGQFMYISSPSLTPIEFKIIALGGTTVSGTVSRDTPYVFSVGTGFNTQMMVNQNNVSSVQNNKGYIVEAEDQIYVTVRLTTTPDSFQGGSLVSKGLAALGTHFRIGAFLNTGVPASTPSHYTFGAILATENNTTIQFSDIKPGVSLINNQAAGNTPGSITLNRGESYVIAVQGPNNANRDGLIGTLISSDKPIAFNCGSIAGTNGDANNLDLGFDQIVSAERTGKEYIFIKGNGSDVVERPLIVADEDNTLLYLNGSNTAFASLNAGEYIALNGSQFSSLGNLYIRTSKNVFAYQGIGGTASQANQNMCFVPPLSCETPKVIDNIPFINRIGNNTLFTGTVAVVTETNADLNFVINGVSYSYATLPSSIVKNGPLAVTGNANYVTYTFTGLSGNISVYSTKQVYLSYFGSSEYATYGGFYSGFTFKPEIAFQALTATITSTCIPNIKLSVNVLTAFDTFQWYFNDQPIPGANTSSYIPTPISLPGGLGPGFYHVKAGISSCGTDLVSDKIPVSSCAADTDNDGTNDNVDTDNDNDGITNCTESYGNLPLNISPSATVTPIQIAGYSNSFTTTATGSGIQPTAPFSGSANGNFTSEAPPGIGNSVSEKISFSSPISIVVDYITVQNNPALLSSGAEFKLQVPIEKTITVLNPDNQLLIDTNYDGIFESGITSFSSFEVRFRLNESIPLAAGSGTFEFRANLIDYITYTHKNLSDTASSSASFRIMASCVPEDSDNDAIPNQLDSDSDNDGIPDIVEALGQNFTAVTFSDSNNNGLNDVYEPGLGLLDSDNDTVPDSLDLDSDNDGIYDLTESGSNAADTDNNGVIDGNSASFGSNGYLDSLETANESNIPNFTIRDTDADGLKDYIDKDSDGDTCNDVIEAGFLDPDGDGVLSSSPIVVNNNGLVTSSAIGYTVPNSNYITAATIIINSQPQNITSCNKQNVQFIVAANTVDSYQWQLSTDGINYSDISNNGIYSGVATDSLTISGITMAMDGYSYRVFINKNGNSCGLFSSGATLNILPLPVVPVSATLVQCDDDLDGLASFNLRQKESLISTDSANQTFAYFKTEAAAQASDASLQITTPTSYNNDQGNTVWVRIENSDNCFEITRLDLVVSATQIPAGTEWVFSECDDAVDSTGNTPTNDKDGITSFDFSTVTADINTILSNNPGYTISYYKNSNDALAEVDAQGNSLAITDFSNYRNTNPNEEFIWVRVDSDIDNACFGLGPYIHLIVNPIPIVSEETKKIVCKGFVNQMIKLNAGVPISNQAAYSYVWYRNGILIVGAESYDLNITEDGIYTTEVTNKTTSCFNTKTNRVSYSEVATLTDIQIKELSEDNSISITVSGLGSYLYSLDNPDGPFSQDNTFENVTPGFHDVYVTDTNGCGTVSKSISVIGAPLFFTPNGDTFNDTWKIKGIDTAFYRNSTVSIFDRFGKLLTQISLASESGWDGTFNGRPLPADDYWYMLNLEDGRVARGHFALKR